MSNPDTLSPRTSHILIVGAYGLIGCGIAHHLLANAQSVVGLGRNEASAKRVLPGIPWMIEDVSTLTDADRWAPLLQNISVVVNCSGALQDGPDDDLEAIHHHAVSTLAQACGSAKVKLIQISAVGATPDAATAFLASKGRGDAAIRSTVVQFNIFRPGLVLAPNACGGSTMLRMLAAIPGLQILAVPDAQIQTVSVDDIARVVGAAIDGRIPVGYEADLVEPEPHSLRDVVVRMRHWLGFRPARHEVIIPTFAATGVSKLADALSYLGWRSPLRTTAFKVLTEGIRGTSVDFPPSA